MRRLTLTVHAARAYRGTASQQRGAHYSMMNAPKATPRFQPSPSTTAEIEATVPTTPSPSAMIAKSP